MARGEDTSNDPRRSIGPAVYAMMKESRARENALMNGDEEEFVHRGNQENDRLYIMGDGSGTDSAFVANGGGRVFYDSPHKAFDEHGILPVTYVDQIGEHDFDDREDVPFDGYMKGESRYHETLDDY